MPGIPIDRRTTLKGVEMTMQEKDDVRSYPPSEEST
jgi:hypothetical protein